MDSSSTRSISVYSRKSSAPSPRCPRPSSLCPDVKRYAWFFNFKSGLFRSTQLNKHLLPNDLFTLGEMIVSLMVKVQAIGDTNHTILENYVNWIDFRCLRRTNKQWEILGSQGLESSLSVKSKVDLQSWFTNTHLRWPATMGISSSQEPNDLFWPPQPPALMCAHAHTQFKIK